MTISEANARLGGEGAGWKALFPYTPRKGQPELMALWEERLAGGGHLVTDCGTGTGKTVCALAPALAAASPSGRRVLYLTRTNSQQRQAIIEARAMAKTCGFPPGEIPACGIQGRARLCPMARDDPDLMGGEPEELSSLCSDMKRAALVTLRGGHTRRKVCHHYLRMCTADLDELYDWMAREVPTPEELAARCDELAICPYELTKSAMEKARAVTAPYIFFFNRYIRRHLLEWMGCSIEDLIVVVDEAHNLPDYARELASAALSLRQLRLALQEAEEFDLPPLSGDLQIRDVAAALASAMVEMVKEFLIDVDGLIPSGELEARLMSSLMVTSHGIRQLARDLVNDGEVVRDIKKRQGRLPRSHLRALGAFLDMWLDMESRTYVPLVLGRRSSERRARPMARLVEDGSTGDMEGSGANGASGGPEPLPPLRSRLEVDVPVVHGHRRVSPDPLLERLVEWERAYEPRVEAFCMDASVVTAALRDTHASLHMSGTLRPLAEYRDVLGLPRDTVAQVFPSPFPPENRLCLYTTDVTTRYEEMERRPEMPERIAGHLEDLLNGCHRNTLVLFPSFEMLERFINGGMLWGVRREKLFGERGLGQRDLMDLGELFRSERGSVLFSVCGGRLSEGIDYPDQDLEMVVMVGIPFPPPTARLRALSYFHDVRFGKGWEYTVTTPTTRKLLQGIGRLIRRPEDRGVAVILDKRARHFGSDIGGLLQSWDPPADVRAFWSAGGGVGRGSP